MALILIIDDEEDTREQVQEMLELDDHECHGAGDMVQGCALLAEKKPDLVLLDINMPWMRGDKMLHDLRSAVPDPPRIVFYSGMDEDELKKLTLQLKVTGYIQKGTAIDAFNRMIGDFLQAPK